MKKAPTQPKSDASQQISDYITGLDDWRGAILAQIREIVLEAAPGLTEEWKWGTPVWSQNGLVCAASAFKDHVKINFFKGPSLKDPKGMFNAGLDAKTMRSIDFHKRDKIDTAGLAALVKEAVAFNETSRKGK
jgi:hypothetical protein